MRTKKNKALAVLMAMLMVVGGLTGLLTPGGSKASAEPEDVQAPAYVGSESSFGYNVYLYFDENLVVEDNELFRSQLSLSIDGADFAALPETVEFEHEDNVLYLNNDYDRQVLLGTNTRLRIASGAFSDAAGNFNEEMILDITPPVLQSAVVSEDKQKVTISFSEAVLENTNETDGDLKNYVYRLPNGSSSNWVSLDADDSVSVEDGKLVIDLAQALTGSNQFIIQGYALKDSSGNVESRDSVTPNIEAGGAESDTAAPELLNYYLSSDLRDLTFVFDENVFSNVADLNARIYRYDPTAYWGYGIDGTVEISANTVTLHFNGPLNNYQYYYSIESGALKDEAGNIGQNSYNTDWLYPNESFRFYGGYLSLNGRLLNLDFNSDLKDNTLDEGVSHLKEKITLSKDGGATFLPLSDEDVVTIQDRRVVILFQDAITSGTVRIKLEAGSIKNIHFNDRTNEEINQLIAYNTPDLTGYFFSDATSDFIFEDNAEWRSQVKNVLLYDDWSETGRVLNSSEYTLTAGKLTVNQGVFQKGRYYQLYVAADGYSYREIDGRAFNSSDLFYMTAPTVNAQGGILAKVKLLRNYDISINSNYAPTQTVVFELFNGQIPVSIVASELNVNTGTYSALFNVSDAATNLNYTVKAFVVNHFTGDFTSVGVNMTTEVTQTEYDLLWNQNNGGDF